MSEFSKRRDDILARLKAQTDRPVELVAVSKRQPDDRIDAVLATRQRVFGENRVQEAMSRWESRRSIEGLTLHLIGPLQSNKAEQAVALFDVIETVDRPKIIKALASEGEKIGRYPDIFIQVNTGREDQKSGVLVDDLAELVDLARRDYPGKLVGLMCIPPVEEPAAPHFALLKKLATRFDLPKVSMGMSSDYEIAAHLGATHVRVGSALFGERPD